MTIPSVSAEAIEAALQTFDHDLRSTPEWSRWDQNKAQVWALEHRGQTYPPKQIISMATELPVNQFSGGPETNTYLATRGFSVRKLHEPTLADTFAAILERYPTARATLPFRGQHEMRELFAQARELLEEFEPVKRRPHLHVVASYGRGNWATIPWIALLDERETKTTQEGTYVVFLFHAQGKGVHLKFGQGVTQAEREHGPNATQVLTESAAALRARCAGLERFGFDFSGRSELGATQRLARLYDASTVVTKFYAREALPTDAALVADLEALLQVYDTFVEEHHPLGAEVGMPRPIALVGTWRNVLAELAEIEAEIAERGGWASWWSFSIKAKAREKLRCPFHVYAHVGQGALAARLRVDAFETSQGNTGMVSPWPELTRPEWRNRPRVGTTTSNICKTWLRIGAVERLTPPASVEDFELALGLSTPRNVLNQNTFGYVLEDSAPEPARPPQPFAEPPLAPGPLAVPEPLPLEWLVERTGLSRDFLAEVVEAILGPSPQVMLAGPPGTSKTWLARELGLYLTRNRPEQLRFVQFHPSYTYEAFLEGLRPVRTAQGIAFELTPGVVLQTLEAMRAAPVEGNEFVVVIDEANRANLPRVLGELMYLFEYRGERVRLQYSSELALPPNLRFIATMNTADRSIRSLDVALRRRFDVFELRPDPELLAQHYRASAATCELPDLAEGFARLNAELELHLDRHHTIGHAFFMRPRMDAVTLRHIWRRRIEPLIEEFFFDQPELAKEFVLERFWPSAADER